MITFKKIEVEFFPENVRRKKRAIALSFYENGKYSFCDCKWLTPAEAQLIINGLTLALQQKRPRGDDYEDESVRAD